MSSFLYCSGFQIVVCRPPKTWECLLEVCEGAGWLDCIELFFPPSFSSLPLPNSLMMLQVAKKALNNSQLVLLNVNSCTSLRAVIQPPKPGGGLRDQKEGMSLNGKICEDVVCNLKLFRNH